MSQRRPLANVPRVSHIAAALAKSKGKAVTPPPETAITPSTPGLGVSAPPMPDASSARTEKSRTPLIVGAVAALIVLGGAGYWLLKPSEPSAAAKPQAAAPAKVAPPAGKVSEAVAANKKDQAALTSELAGQKTAAKPVEAPPAEVPTGDFHDLVRKLNVAAVMEGANGRAVIDGKKVSVGAEVLPGLWLREIKNGRLVFRDAQANEYVRRF